MSTGTCHFEEKRRGKCIEFHTMVSCEKIFCPFVIIIKNKIILQLFVSLILK